MTDPVTHYARRVVDGKVPAGQWHRAACLRHLQDRQAATARGLLWRPKLARDAITVISTFRQYKGEWAGHPLTLEPWQQFILGSLIGWRREDGLRRYRTAFVEVPRGQGKSTCAAAFALYCTFLEGEPGADGFCAATKRDQARVVFEVARQMTMRTAALRSRISVQNHNLYSLESASKLEPLSAEANTLDGLRPHIVIADEVHAHPTGDVINVLSTGMGTRRQPIMLEITTAGVNRQGPWWAHREYSRLLFEGRAEDDAWFAFIAGADEGDDWTDPATWRKANPNYGVSVKPDYLESRCREAQAMAVFQNDFRRLHVGQLVEQETRVLDRAHWDACAVLGRTLEDYRGRVCYAGLDLSTTTDLTACVLVFPEDDGSVMVFPVIWLPQQTIAERTQRDRVPYDLWARQGLVRVTPGNVTDYDRIRADINDLAKQYRLIEVAYDPWNATQLATQLAGDLGSNAMVECRQGYRTMSEPTKRLVGLVTSRQLHHPGHAVLSWCADNLTVITDPAGNMKPDKGTAIERIDAMVACIMGLSRWMLRAAPARSVYQSRGAYVVA